MNDALRTQWERVVQADNDFQAAVSEIPTSSLVELLTEALGNAASRTTALRIVQTAPRGIVLPLLPAVFPSTLSSHAPYGPARQIFASLSSEDLAESLPPLVDAVLDNPDSDDETYERLGELLKLLDQSVLLQKVREAAFGSSNPHIREAGENMG